jgi:hypothetical protein
MRQCQCAGCRMARDELDPTLYTADLEASEMIALAIAAIAERHGLDDTQALMHLKMHAGDWPGTVQ